MPSIRAWYSALPSLARRRVYTYAGTALLLTTSLFAVQGLTWEGSTQLHTIMEVTATVLALIVGALALVRFYSVSQPLYLFVGTAFLGTGFLDGYHALVTSTFFLDLFPSSPPSLIAWSWIASRFYLSLMLFYSYLDWRRRQRNPHAAVMRDQNIYAGTLILCLGSFLFFAFVPLPPAYYPDMFLHRPEEWVPGLFFLLALIGYLRKGRWREDRFEHWLVMSLIVGVIGQAVFMPFSGHLFDAYFDLAHLLKKVSYVLVMTGLMVSTYYLFRQAEEGADELARSNDALRDSETRVRAVLNSVGEGIVMINERGGIESFNPAGLSMFGYKLNEILGQNVSILMPEAERTAHHRHLKRYTETGESHIIGTNREVVAMRRDGVRFPIELSVNELWLGGERKFVGVLRDITQRVRSRQALVEATRSRQAILDSANLSIIATDPDGVILSFNHAAERMLRYQAEEVVGKVTPAIIHDGAEVVKRAEELSRELGRTIEPGFEVFVAKARLGLADEREWTYVRKDGGRFPVMLSVTAIRDEQDNITGFLGVAADITERKKIDRMKNEFISVVSHELRTPLTSIRGSLGLVAGGVAGELPERARSLIDIASNNSERLVRLINDILDIEKIEAGKLEFRIEPMDLLPVIERAILDNKGFADAHRIQVKLMDAVNLRVLGDHDRLIQVITNLISNAVKFSPPSRMVEISVSSRNDMARIAVKDQGPGIPEDFRERVFEKFAQADGSDTRARGGTGLGLNICKALIEHMGGHIDFANRPEGGAIFFCELPLVQEGTREQAPASQPIQHQDEPSILVCEDDTDVAHLLRLMLENAGYRVDLAHDAIEARQMLDKNSYMAMTLDIMLPGKDGLTLVRELRNESALCDLPIVVVSAIARHGKQELNGRAIGIVDWLDKPIDQERLLAAVDRIARLHEGPAEILHVEDDDDVRKVVADILSDVANVTGVATLAAAVAAIDHTQFDLIILDIGLPDGDGVSLLSMLKSRGTTTPVVVFSARDLAGVASESLASVLVKSATSNAKLFDTIKQILARSTKRVEPQSQD